MTSTRCANQKPPICWWILVWHRSPCVFAQSWIEGFLIIFLDLADNLTNTAGHKREAQKWWGSSPSASISLLGILEIIVFWLCYGNWHVLSYSKFLFLSCDLRPKLQSHSWGEWEQCWLIIYRRRLCYVECRLNITHEGICKQYNAIPRISAYYGIYRYMTALTYSSCYSRVALGRIALSSFVPFSLPYVWEGSSWPAIGYQ
jgi:hypothetical protein